MGIALGNLSVREIENRLGISLTDEERATLEKTRERTCANVTAGKDIWHCYDIPFDICCGSNKIQKQWVDILTPYVEYFKVQVQISTLQEGGLDNRS